MTNNFKTLATTKCENVEISALQYGNTYIICAYVDGIVEGTYGTNDKEEAIEVYRDNVEDMWEKYRKAVALRG